jgi:hypothetical protein
MINRYTIKKYGSRYKAPHILNFGFWMEMSSQLHVPATFPPGPNGQEARWVPELVWTR